MPVVLGIDLGTTTLTALALDAAGGDILACATAPNRAEIASPADRARGRSEWDAQAVGRAACDCLRAAAGRLGGRARDLAGLGITGQQHGVVLVGDGLRPLTPLVGWQDRRGEEEHAGSGKSFVRRAVELAGEDAPGRTGCRLAAGYLAVTLFWLKETGALPAAATACFLTDYFGALLTGRRPVTDPTFAASSGAFDVRAGAWDGAVLAALGLPRSLLPEVRPSGELLGHLTPEAAEATGLPAGLPVFVGVGDNQASFLGSVADREDTVLVNVGTGGQVAVWSEEFHFGPLLEARPLPGGGYLLVCAGLCGGRAYAVLEDFFRQVGSQLFGVTAAGPLYDMMNRLAADVPRGAGGVSCEPFFTGTRDRPELRAGWEGISAETCTPAHLTRALLEGMAQAFRSGYEAIVRKTGRPARRLVGAGNGLRENPVLAGIVAGELGLPLAVPRHREEAAFGAALVAAVGAGACPDLAAAGRLIRYGAAAGGAEFGAG
jgi:sugar (pentulose or hexulose) kinase